MFIATRLFASNLNEKMAQRFYNLVLLPKLREDIEVRKRCEVLADCQIHSASHWLPRTLSILTTNTSYEQPG